MKYLFLADWLILEYFGKKYGSHCGNTRRKAIFFIECDRSADTHVSFYLQVQINLVKNYVCPGPPRGGAGGGQLSPSPKQVGAPNLRNILKLNKAPSKSGLVQGINGYFKGIKGLVYRYT